MATIRYLMITPDLKNVLSLPFPLMGTRHDKIIFIMVTAVFSLLFMYIFLPFNINGWYDLNRHSLFVIFSAFSFSGALTILFTQFGVRKWLNLTSLSYLQYFLWVVGELLLLSVVMLFIDWLFNSHPAISLGNFLTTFKYTSLIVVIPYIISLLILFVRQKSQMVQSLSSKVDTVKPVSEYLAIEDENGKVILSLQPKYILFFKAEDNYVDVHYLHGGTVKKELIRTSLKRIESKCTSPCLFRVHRSYTVNIWNVSSFRKTPKGYMLQFDLLPDLEIPVSASYQDQFGQLLVNTDAIAPIHPIIA